jgi:murein DD-endopeptidase MepM/ murein hydrolase activator NlpD/pimeloyl-ACP methyl ester carboxylesterase
LTLLGVLAGPGSAVAADRISWRDCGTRLQCARVPVPLDWARPNGRKIELAVLRRRASQPDRRLGALFFNPGGPGSSGIDVIKDPFSADLLDAAGDGRFDLISWDPRGVGASTRVRCFRSQAGEARFWGDLTIPTTTAASRRYAAKARAYARRCGDVSGALLRHISTADTIRDLDHLRRLAGERKLNYVGWSYGTFLGQTYANVYPDRVRAMVLDAVVDAPRYVRGRESSVDNVITPADPVFEQFLALCQAAGPEHVRADGKTEGCALAGEEPVKERVDRLLRQVRTSPIPAPSADPPGPLTYSKLLTSIFPMLRNPGGWPEWARNLEAAVQGDGSALANIANASPPGAGGAPAPVSIGCADSPARQPLTRWPDVIGRLTQTSPLAGPVLGWWLWAPCAAWPARSAQRYTGPWNAKTPNPVLVIGTRYDPNTAYANAQATAKRLGNAVLLTHDGYGHISFVDPSACVMAVYRRYLTELKPPARGTVCPSDRGPFDPEFGEPLPAAPQLRADGTRLTPVIQKVLSTPRWYRATDGRVHLSYELLLTNTVPLPIDIRAVRVLDEDGRTVATLTGSRLQAATSLVATPDDPTTTLPPSNTAIVWVDLDFARPAQVPRRIAQRLTVDIGPDHPELGQLLTDTAGSARVSRRGPTVLSPPLRGGRWVGIVGPHRRALNPVNGRIRLGQRFAVDFSARLDAQGRTHVGDPNRNDSYFDDGQPVLAVGDGVVVSVVDRLPNQIPNDKAPVAVSERDGNHVILRLRDGVFAAYGHLAPGSVRVRRGQRVRSGQVIGRLGNSGNSGGPHLHFQLVNRASFLDGDGLPFVIDRFRLDGRVPSLDAFIAADADPLAPPVPLRSTRAATRRDQGLANLDVVSFPTRAAARVNQIRAVVRAARKGGK